MDYYRLNTKWTTTPPYEYGGDLQREKIVFSFELKLNPNDVVLLAEGTSVYAITVVKGKNIESSFILENGVEYEGGIYDVEWIDILSSPLTVCRPNSDTTASAYGYTI
jgi:hypothetical protein